MIDDLFESTRMDFLEAVDVHSPVVSLQAIQGSRDFSRGLTHE